MPEGPPPELTVTLLKAVTASLVVMTPVFYLAYRNRLPDRLPRTVLVVAVLPPTFVGVFYLDGVISLRGMGIMLLGVVLAQTLLVGAKRAYRATKTVGKQLWEFFQTLT